MKVYFLVFLLILSYSSCSISDTPYTDNSEPKISETKVLGEADNKKYKIKIIFYGREITSTNGRKDPNITHVILRDESGREVKYIPPDAVARESPINLFFFDVWSPGEEYLVLPRGDFDGYCIIKTTEAMNLIEQQKCNEFFQVSAYRDGPLLHHYFLRWIGADTFEFQAGLSGTIYNYRYNVRTGEITSTDDAEFFVKNSRGDFTKSRDNNNK